jgi:hypothetical protein
MTVRSRIKPIQEGRAPFPAASQVPKRDMAVGTTSAGHDERMQVAYPCAPESRRITLKG